MSAKAVTHHTGINLIGRRTMLSMQRWFFSLLLIISILCVYWMIRVVDRVDLRPRKLLYQFFGPLEVDCVGVDGRSIVQRLVVISKQLEYAATNHQFPTTRQTNEIHEIIRRLDPLYANDSLPDSSSQVCSESYKGRRLGWVTNSCTYAKPLSKLIEILLYYPRYNEKRLLTVLRGIGTRVPDVQVRVAVRSLLNVTSLIALSRFPNIDIMYTNSAKPGLIWNQLVSSVSTPYVLVGRYLDNFKEGPSSLERQIRMLETVKNVQVVGGSFRNQSGHWRVGCLQADMRNYALTYQEGYFYSRNECMFCEHLLGPFVTRTKFLLDLPLNDSMPAAVLFEDWFLQVKLYPALVMNCPDVMYFATDPAAAKKSTNNKVWRPLCRKWELNKLRWPPNSNYRFTCGEVEMTCTNIYNITKYYLTPLCCLEEMRQGIKAINQIFTKHSVLYEIFSGSVLSAVKMADFLPWDLDFDIVHKWNLTNHWRYAKEIFSQRRMILDHINEYKYTNFFRLFTSSDTTVYGGFFFEMWPTKYSVRKGFQLHSSKVMTRLNIHGVWVPGPPNPGDYARRRYGREMLKHAHNWRHEKNGKETGAYEAGRFHQCPAPTHHSCLDHFPSDGNLNFKVK